MLHEVVGGARLSYQTDEFGNYYGFRYQQSGQSESWYSYVFNAQGDVIGIVDTSGAYVAKYSYDAWGKPVAITDGSGTDVSANASHIANINPIRYRGYYFDKETGLYYLQTRYYDPVVGRFINADTFVKAPTGGVLSTNMFAYCLNSPVNNYDVMGKWTLSISCDFSLGFFAAGSYSVTFLAIDGKGNFRFGDISSTEGVGLGFGPYAGFGPSVSWTKDEFIGDTYGKGYDIGFGASYFGFDLSLDESRKFSGFSIGAGIGAGADIHALRTYSAPFFDNMTIPKQPTVSKSTPNQPTVSKYPANKSQVKSTKTVAKLQSSKNAVPTSNLLAKLPPSPVYSC